MSATARQAARPSRPSARVLVPRSALLGAAVTAALFAAGSVQADDAAASDSDELEPVITVIGDRIRLDSIPGSGTVIDAGILTESRVFTINEALRKVPGVLSRDE